MHEKSPDITNKSIIWGDTSDFIANVEIFFVCCGKFLEDTIQNNFQKFRKFSRQISVAELFLVQILSLWFTGILLMILKHMILWNLTREEVVWRCSVEMVLLKISQYS